MRILFMGTPDFAVPSLNALIKNNYEVVGVVTQTDRPKGRGYELKAPPVKECAMAHNIPVYQPDRLSKEPEMIQKLSDLHPDLIVTCAFGQILPQSILDIPKFGTINVHGSLLPKYRGAAPIQWAIINGDEKTGITTMLTDIGLDTGDMLLKSEIEIPIDMTAGELHDRMSVLGAETLIKTVKALEEGSLERIKQDESQASYAPKIDKKTGLIDWTKPSLSIHNLVRGTTPWPGAYTQLNGLRTRIWRTKMAPVPPDVSDSINGAMPGTILKCGNKASSDTSMNEQSGMWVRTGDGALLVCEIQAGSGKRMTPREYGCGHELKAGMMLTPLSE